MPSKNRQKIILKYNVFCNLLRMATIKSFDYYNVF
nr:MAG TPA: hypothetical protein [Caudoviricetes sp.]